MSLALVMFGAAAFLYMARKFIEALQVCEQAQVDVDFETFTDETMRVWNQPGPDLRIVP